MTQAIAQLYFIATDRISAAKPTRTIAAMTDAPAPVEFAPMLPNSMIARPSMNSGNRAFLGIRSLLPIIF